MVGRVSSPRFVGRREELETLRAAVARAGDGVGSAVLIGAEAGMGKSRLIAELTAIAREAGATVLTGECLPQGEVPYAPIAAALRSLVRERGADTVATLAGAAREELAQLLPELGATGEVAHRTASEGSQGRLFEQLLGVLVAAAREAPVALVVEDLHWADRSTRDFLTFLVRGARREPLALIASYRSDELQRSDQFRPFILELERSGQAMRVELRRFSRSETREQIAAILGRPPEPALVDRLLERSEGNPFFTEELLASASAPGAALPESLRQALLLRVESHPEQVKAVLRIVAVAGRTIDHALLELVAGLSRDELLAALREAVEGYVLVHDPGSTGYSFRHALLREAVYADLLPGERGTLHVMLARALEERPELAGSKATAAAEPAFHWYAAGELSEALPASINAGVAAESVHALGEALLHYERALKIWDAAAPAARELALDRIDVIRRAADAASLTGATARAIALAHQLLEEVDPIDASRAARGHERLGRYLWLSGRGVDALPEYGRAVELMPADPPSEERAYVLATEAQVLMLVNRNEESASRCEEALRIARLVDAAGVEAHVLNTMCANFSGVGDPERGAEAAAQARSIARGLGLAEEVGRSYINGSDALDQAGRVEESIALASEGIQVSIDSGADLQIGDFLRAEIAGRMLRTGRWSEADALLEELLDRELTGITASMAYTYLGHLCAERGELDLAARALERDAELSIRAGGSMWVGPLGEGQATLELWAGRPEDAARTVFESLDAIADAGEESLFFISRLYELGARACADLAARALGDEHVRQREAARADQLLERLDRLIAQLTGKAPPRVQASREACAAELARIRDTSDPSLWETTQRLWDACGDRYQAAYARWRRAEALLTGGGDLRDAGALVREAHAVASELSARPLRDELEALARRARLGLTEQHPSEATGNTPLLQLDLTPRELEVLALLADGMTNREIAAELFISNKTASVHVSRILGKLSVPNRAAAAAAAQRLGVSR